MNEWMRHELYIIRGRTDPDGSPDEVVAEVELLDVNAVGDETLQLNSVHSDGVREHDQLFTLNMYTYEKYVSNQRSQKNLPISPYAVC